VLPAISQCLGTMKALKRFVAVQRTPKSRASILPGNDLRETWRIPIATCPRRSNFLGRKGADLQRALPLISKGIATTLSRMLSRVDGDIDLACRNRAYRDVGMTHAHAGPYFRRSTPDRGPSCPVHPGPVLRLFLMAISRGAPAGRRSETSGCRPRRKSGPGALDHII